MLMVAMLMAMQAAPVANPGIVAAQAAAGLAPLSGDAIRFTDLAPAGQAATVFEARRTAAGSERTIVALARGDGDAWTVQSRETRRLAGETFDYMATRIDAAIAAGSDATPCEDGSDYLSEHAAGGAVRRIEGACPDGHPNVAIALLFGVREAK